MEHTEGSINFCHIYSTDDSTNTGPYKLVINKFKNLFSNINV